MYWYQYELSSSYFEILHPNKKKVWWYGGRANLQTFEQNFCRNEVLSSCDVSLLVLHRQ
jgi:coproporphyrinogen III oxidase|tara:strand:- start:90 stop:266 length:177 start_codon:yes stop_codon:yes gene_type:complete